MALLNKAGSGRVGFFRSIRLRIFLTVVAVYVLFCIVFSHFVFNIWEQYWLRQRQAETSRYCNLIASEISYAQREGTSLSNYLRTEMQDSSRMYSYLRLMILNDKGQVLYDSSQARNGSYMINDEVLSALAGTSASGLEEGIYRLAVPIQSDVDQQIIGVVCAFAGTEQLQQTVKYGEDLVVMAEFFLGLIVIVGLYFLIALQTKPLEKILRWLKLFKSPERDEFKPKFKIQDEYAEIVDSVEQATKDLQTVDRSRKEFVSNVSHELKTPLSSIKVLTESLLLQESAPEEVYREFLQDINSEIDRMNNIVNDLLTLVRLEEREKALNLSNFDLIDLIEAVFKRLSPLAQDRGISMVLDTEFTSLEVEADETKLTLAISNLIQNAIKYNKDQGKITVYVKKTIGFALITVEDTGIGIDAEHFDKLFDRFYRVDKARDRQTGGSGLGLSIVRQVVNLHNGEISVESKPGVGSRFTVKLPLEQDIEGEDDV